VVVEVLEVVVEMEVEIAEVVRGAVRCLRSLQLCLGDDLFDCQ